MERLRHIREQAGLSQPELSEISGVAQGTISDIELDKRKPRGRTLRKLAQALGVEVADLIGDPELPLGEALPSPEQPPLNGFFEEERRIIPQSADSLRGHIREMKVLRELREAEIEEIEKGFGHRHARVFQMEMADKGLSEVLEELGVLAFAEGVKAGRVMADPKAIPLCHELLRRLAELEALSAEARGSNAAVSSDIYVEGVKGVPKIEAWVQAERQPEDSGG